MKLVLREGEGITICAGGKCLDVWFDDFAGILRNSGTYDDKHLDSPESGSDD